jgi:hypothetical protein
MIKVPRHNLLRYEEMKKFRSQLLATTASQAQYRLILASKCGAMQHCMHLATLLYFSERRYIAHTRDPEYRKDPPLPMAYVQEVRV